MRRATTAVFLGLAPAVASAEVVEMTQAELRHAVEQDRAIPTRALIGRIEDFTGGQVVDIRAFLDGSEVVYRILYLDDGGALGTVLMDGSTGLPVAPDTRIGEAIGRFVETRPAQGNAGGLPESQNSIVNADNNSDTVQIGGNDGSTSGEIGQDDNGGGSSATHSGG